MDLEDKGNFMELNWGNILHFNSEKDYYEVLGFLSKEAQYSLYRSDQSEKQGLSGRGMGCSLSGNPYG